MSNNNTTSSCIFGEVTYNEGETIVDGGLFPLQCVNQTAYLVQTSICDTNGTLTYNVERKSCPLGRPFCFEQIFDPINPCSTTFELELTNNCCIVEDGPGGCPDSNGNFQNCWDEGGYCCSDNLWYSDHGDGSNNCLDNNLTNGIICDCTTIDCCKYVGGTIIMKETSNNAGPICVYTTFDGRTLEISASSAAASSSSLAKSFPTSSPTLLFVSTTLLLFLRFCAKY